MYRKLMATLGLLGLLACVVVPLHGQAPASIPPDIAKLLAAVGPMPGAGGGEKKFEDFDKLVKGAKEHEGLFHLYQKDEDLFAEIRPEQFDRPLLAPIAIARGMGAGGYTLNFDDQWVLIFKRVGDKIHLIRRNVHFKATPGTPAAKAVETTYTDSVLMALRIRAINPMKNAAVINLNDIFFTDFAQLGLGSPDRDRTVWHKVKTFPRNIELQVAATFGGGGFGGRRGMGSDSVIDDRGNTVVIHYGLVELPEFGYQPRLADDRVGYFLSVVKDFSSESKDTSFVRYVNRWRLERADGTPWKEGGKLSPPKKKIVFWIEKSVPDEYRAAVREGILEWNKAFEKIGFRDAIEVRQQENEDFDPEDINYNTFRWITTDMGFAMGPSRANPLTGEILDADIIFDASMVRFFKQERQLFAGKDGQPVEEPASLIQATRQGWGLPNGVGPGGWNDRAATDPQAHARAIRQGFCQCASHMHGELGLALMAMAAREGVKPGDKLPDEMIQQAIKEVTMHEVGHTLGLRHNFKASTMLKNDQLHDTAITRKQGLVGSVMDYNPVNLAPKGVKQGDYFTTTIGPYDYWAIEYAYKPLSGGTTGEVEELKKIASKGAQPGHDYATDEDMFGTSDPLVNVWDLGSDPMQFGIDRMALAEELMKGLADRVVEKGEGYQRARRAFALMLGQYGNAAYLVSAHVGGEHMNRDHRGDPKARDPFVPVKAAKQREALKFLQEHLFSDKPFQFPPELLRKLAADRWYHWGNEMAIFGGVEYPLHERILRIQQVAMGQLLDPGVLARVQNLAMKADKDEQPLTVAEIFRSLSTGVWADLPEKAGEKPAVSSSVIRRNLQRAYLKDLSGLVLGPRASETRFAGFVFSTGGRAAPPDARSLARMHLREAGKRIDLALADKKLDDTVRAHLEEGRELIAKVLGATMQANTP